MDPSVFKVPLISTPRLHDFRRRAIVTQTVLLPKKGPTRLQGGPILREYGGAAIQGRVQQVEIEIIKH